MQAYSDLPWLNLQEMLLNAARAILRLVYYVSSKWSVNLDAECTVACGYNQDPQCRSKVVYVHCAVSFRNLEYLEGQLEGHRLSQRNKMDLADK